MVMKEASATLCITDVYLLQTNKFLIKRISKENSINSHCNYQGLFCAFEFLQQPYMKVDNK